MQRAGWIISRYLLTAVIPYAAFAWALLSVILFVQQASRYSDIFFSANIPSSLVWQLTVALIPNVIAFTCPMAILVGTIIGLAKMQTDNELVAIRAAGVGNVSIALPIMVLGVLLSAFAFIVNLYGVPLAASLVHNVALESAIKKLESPLEPGVFNTEVAGYTIYVKGGDIETGRWKNVFIYNEDPANRAIHLITSQRGRVDTTGQQSELVLENASVSTLPMTPGEGKYVSESIGEVRLAIKTRRSDLIERLGNPAVMPAELGLRDLSNYAASQEGRERTEAEILWQRRILLSITPFIFCILGTVLVLRYNRGGRGAAVALSLAVFIAFYLISFLCEQLARTGVINVTLAGALPVVAAIAYGSWLHYGRRLHIAEHITNAVRSAASSIRSSSQKLRMKDMFLDVTTGIRDFDLIRNLVQNFLLALAFLAAIFLIFTAFELWKFAGSFAGGVTLLLKYLLFLLPFVYLQVAAPVAMIATLATFVIKSRQNELVTWVSAGESVYRLLLPCFLLMFVIGLVNWPIQEKLLPWANQKQDETRDLLRNEGKPPDPHGKYWIANEHRIYSFDLPASDNEKQDQGSRSTVSTGNSASDNDNRDASNCFADCVRALSVYEFDDSGTKLQSVYRASSGLWENGRVILRGNVEKDVIADGQVRPTGQQGGELADENNPFAGLSSKPSHLSTSELRQQRAATDADIEQRALSIAIDKRYTSVLLPLIIALFTAPFALRLDRKGKAALTIGYAISLWLVFTGTGNVFEQLGLAGLLPAALAVWSPLFIFSFLGIYLLSRVRT